MPSTSEINALRRSRVDQGLDPYTGAPAADRVTGDTLPGYGGGGAVSTQGQPGSGAVNAQGQIVGAGGKIVGMANPKDMPGYNPAKDPTSSLNVGINAGKQSVPQTAPNQAQVNAPNQPFNPQAEGLLPYNQASANLQANTALSASEKTAIGDTLKRKYGVALENVKNSGQQSPVGGGDARTAISGALPPEQDTSSVLTGVVDTDNTFDSIFTEYDKFMSPITQKTSLVDEYSKLQKSLGIDSINAELIDAKRIIEGTEDDIRSEITATGGFGTESQVLALANARNKSLIKNYNYLLDAKSNAMTQLNTMMQLTIADRQSAEAEWDRKMNFGFKVMEFKERAQNNAKQTYITLGDKMGWDTLFGSMSSYEQGVAQKTMGISAQQAQQLSLRSSQDRANAQAKEALQLRVLESSLLTDSMQRQKIGADITKTYADMGLKPDGTPTSASIPKLSQAQSNIESIDSLLTSGGLNSSVGTSFLSRGPSGFWGTVGRAASIVGLPSAIGGTYRNMTGERQNFIAGVEQLRSNLNLETLIKAKSSGATFGALSDQELKLLASSASKIGTWADKDKEGNVKGYNASEKDFKAELDKINNFAKLDFVLKGGDPASVGVTVMPDGHYYTKNSNGDVIMLD